eukprot:6462677-Amphidinium_carterae.1
MLQFAGHDDRGHVTRTVGDLEQRATIRDMRTKPPLSSSTLDAPGPFQQRHSGVKGMQQSSLMSIFHTTAGGLGSPRMRATTSGS